MRVRLFGKTNDDKGAQLEKLTKRLLEQLGYKNVTTNFIGSGGNELDIHGEFPVPTLSGTKSITIIGECKAYERPISLPDWLKFLGKIFTERMCRPIETRGVFLALSGANGNVLGAYGELRHRSDVVDLIAGSALSTLLTQEFKLETVDAVRGFVASFTSEAITEISVTYYKGNAYWIIEFSNACFTVLPNSDLRHEPPAEIIDLLTANLQASRYRDLRAEEAARHRHNIARKFALGQLLTGKSISGDAWERLEIPDLGVPLTSQEIQTAIDELRVEGKISESPTPTLVDLKTNVALRADVLRELVTGFFILNYYGSDEWNYLIDEDILDQSLRIKDDLTIPAEDKPKMLCLLKWSPSALAWALHPDAVTGRYENEPPEIRERMRPEHARFYEVQIMQAAAADFRSNMIGAAMYQKYRLRELDVRRTVTFKSDAQTEVKLELNERFRLGELDTGGVVLIWLVNNAPEPWVRPETDIPGNTTLFNSQAESR